MNWQRRRSLYLASTFIEAVAVTLANRVRRLLRMEVPRHPTHVFLRIFLLHALGRAQSLRVTCSGRSDGAGAQAHTKIAAMSFARASGSTYLHTPFCNIAHADRPMDEWVSAWEQLFNFGEDREIGELAGPRVVNYSAFHPRLYHMLLDALAGVCGHLAAAVRGTAYRRSNFHPFFYFADAHPEAYRDVIPELRKRYYHHRSPVKNSVLTIAVHVRRGDVTVQHHRRYTPIAKVVRTTERILSAMKGSGRQVRIVVHSVGCAEEFAPLRGLGVELNLYGDAIATFRQLVEADILVMSKSSFSYVAALLSDGLVLYEPFWHSPLSDWISLDRKGTFDVGIFLRTLDRIEFAGPDQGWQL